MFARVIRKSLALRHEPAMLICVLLSAGLGLRLLDLASGVQAV